MFCGQSTEEGSHGGFEACGNEIDKFPAGKISFEKTFEAHMR